MADRHDHPNNLQTEKNIAAKFSRKSAKCRKTVESKLEDGHRQCSFCLGCSTMDQIFILKQILEKSWEYGRNLHA